LTATPVKDAIVEVERQKDVRRKKKEEANENKKQKTTIGMQTQKKKLAKVILHFSSHIASVDLCADKDDLLYYT